MTRGFDVDRYLDRIGCGRPDSPSAGSLAALQRRHMQTVPFENLDIHRGCTLSLELDALHDKVVRRRRGGFCYELNGLFAHLLGELGHDVTLLSCQTHDGDGQLGPEHDHLALLVRCDGRWLVDVGFGDAFAEPLDLDRDDIQVRGARAYRVTEQDGALTYAEESEGSWSPQYTFTLEARTLQTFHEMCLYYQRSPDSPFTRKRVCTRLTEDGRITLRDNRLIHTIGAQRTESPVDDESAFRAALVRHFGVELD